jgi:hypothetical protein
MERLPGKLPNTSSRLIAMAVNLLGSSQEVMARMKCSAVEFEDYCASRKEPTWAQLDRLVTLIVDEQQAGITKNREFLRAARRKRKPGTEP